MDAFGTEEGGCERTTDSLWVNYVDRIKQHLGDGEPMGVYPMVHVGDFWQVNWGCVDFDEGEETAWIEAQNLRVVLGELGITGWVERSRSKGFHVWVFTSAPTRAEHMRKTLLGATQIAKASTKEINPKQSEMAEGQLGNYVRLPYPHALTDSEMSDRRVMVSEDGFPIRYADFVETAHQQRANPALFEQYQSLWKPPRKAVQSQSLTITADELDGDLPSIYRMSKRTHHAFSYGPFEDTDRSGFLFRLGLYLADDGFTPNEALALLCNADERWGKFIERGDLHEIEKIVSKVYK
jgi:hypothetical protein